jgi:hypothetical protein
VLSQDSPQVAAVAHHNLVELQQPRQRAMVATALLRQLQAHL